MGDAEDSRVITDVIWDYFCPSLATLWAVTAGNYPLKSMMVRSVAQTANYPEKRRLHGLKLASLGM
jgi:hypothetical protein